MIKRLKLTLDANIDYVSAVIAAILLGAIVFLLNNSHGVTMATTAAIKQAVYTFFVAGFIVKNNERMVRRFSEGSLLVVSSLLFTTTISSCLAIGLTLLVHSLKGTPEPLLSTLPTAIMGPPGFLFLGWRVRNKMESEQAIACK